MKAENNPGVITQQGRYKHEVVASVCMKRTFMEFLSVKKNGRRPLRL